jgi:hypothetical protein
MSASKVKRCSVKEVTVERYFVEQVEKAGGMTEKFTSPGKKFVPDRLVTWPAYGFARIHFVELKTLGGKCESGQERDHARRRKLGCAVFVLWTMKQVDSYVSEYCVPF